MSLSAVLEDIVDVPQPFRNSLARVLGFKEADRLYASLKEPGAHSIHERLLNHLAVTYRVGERDLKQIPKTGPVVVVANHPFGILEGAVLATVLARVRPDVRFLANQILSVIPEIQDLLIPVDPRSGDSAARSNLRGLRRSIEFLRNGGCLVVFPAGEVSHFDLRNRAILDPQWHTAVARMIEGGSRSGMAASIVPVYIEGANSLLFQAVGLIHPRLRTMLLLRELLNKRNRMIDLRIGGPISSRKLLEIPTAEERTEYLRWRTYLLASRPEYKAKTSVPLRSRLRRSPQPIREAIDPALLSREIDALSPDHHLARTSDLDVYIAPSHVIPSLVAEIGRLRELTFRAAGEGTGKTTDLDRFDCDYLHLFAWNAAKREIAGAYRMVGTDRTRDLYTRTLFKYKNEFLDRMGPALELGRSFVRTEYQKGFAPLLALWKGIGAYIAQNPQYRILFGPVSISNQYQSVSRELMVAVLAKHLSPRDWVGLVSANHPFRKRSSLPAGIGVEDLSDVVSDLEPTGMGIPVLLRQYLKLGGNLLGFNVDPEFSNSLDGLIVVDLLKTERKLLERYLGKRETAEFLEYQRGTYAT